MTFVATIIKWAMENSRLLRIFLVIFAATLAAFWFHHDGARTAASALHAKEQLAVLHVKEQYDEISNHRPDDHGLLKLLRAGQF